MQYQGIGGKREEFAYLGVRQAFVGVASPPPIGVSAPGSQLIRCARRASCAAMAVSLSLYPPLCTTLRQLCSLLAACSDGIK